MAKIRNIFLLKRFTDFLRLKVGDMLGAEVSPIIIPTINIPVDNRVVEIRSGARATTGTTTIFTTDERRRTFLTGITLMNQSDVTADNTAIAVQATEKGKTQINFLNLRKITLTAFNGITNLILDPPVELEPNTTIAISSTFTVGASTSAATITFFEEEAF